MIYIGFYYQNTLPDAQLWRVIDIEVAQGGEIEIVTHNEFYVYNGTSWSQDTGAYFLSSADYEEMGLFFPNFSSSNRAEIFLPLFLVK